MTKTHEVTNQPTELVDVNLYTTDPILQKAVETFGAGWHNKQLTKYGEKIGSATVQKWADEANRHTPRLITHDRFGNRADIVEYHPSYHELMKLDMEFSLHNLPWTTNKVGSHVARSAMMYLSPQGDFGHGCPFAMTYAVVPSLKKQPDVYKAWKPYLESNEYDPRFIPIKNKKSAIFGMAMTEKQGGSDLRANTSKAVAIGAEGPGKEYLLTGHKWFCSAPMSDAFLTLAKVNDSQPPTCFLIPRFLPDGTKNNFFIQRLKDKVGNKSNASSEIEFSNAWAVMIGEEHRGIATIIEMAHHTRLDCIAASAGMVRFALVQALHHCRERKVFGKNLIDQPMMKNVLADLCLESEAMTLLAMRLAKAFDKSDKQEELFQRIATPIAKYWVCKRAESLIPEMMECMGSNTFIEESPMARLYRDIPTNALWEGPGNVMGLDFLRSLAKEPETVAALQKELTIDANSDYKKIIENIFQMILSGKNLELNTRRIMEGLALSLQASLLFRYSDTEIAETFCQTRLIENHRILGTLPSHAPFERIVKRTYLVE